MQRTLIAVWFGAAAAIFAQPANYQLDPAQTKVNFTVGDTLHKVNGTFKLKSGSLYFDPATGSVQGAVVVDATSGNSGSAGRDSRMNSKILESSRYPEIVFRPDRVEGKIAAEGASAVRVHGVFSIHGADHELTVPARVKLSGGDMTAELTFQVPYVKWGMKNPSMLMLRVGDQVEISIHAVGNDPHASGVTTLSHSN
jgi:polyisoprenoid-binding protein YceI